MGELAVQNVEWEDPDGSTQRFTVTLTDGQDTATVSLRVDGRVFDRIALEGSAPDWAGRRAIVEANLYPRSELRLEKIDGRTLNIDVDNARA